MLDQFIENELEKYEEPERRGTARGEPVGFDKRKLFVCLLTGLTNSDLQQISEKNHVSYGLLRVWRTQEDYKKREEYFREMFADLFVKRFIEIIKDSKKDAFSEIEEIFKSLHPELMGKIMHQLPSSTNYFLFFDRLRQIAVDTGAKKGRDREGRLKLKSDWQKDEIRLAKNGVRVLIKLIEDEKPDSNTKKVAIEILKKSCE